MNPANNKTSLLKVYLLLANLEGIFALSALALIPSDSKNAMFLGYSASRLVLMGAALFILLAFLALLGWTMTSSGSPKVTGYVDGLLAKNLGRYAIVGASLLLMLGGTALLLIPAQRWGEALDRFERIAPLVAWITILALQTLIVQFFWLGGKVNWRRLRDWEQPLRIAGLSAGVFAVLSALVLWSRIGITPDRSGWYMPGTPLLITQVFFAWLIGLGLIFWGGRIENWRVSLPKKVNLDLVIFIVLWIAASLIWTAEPMRKFAYFSQEPTPPNFEYYPYSDARLYDEASQNILIGAARDFRLILRPLYSFFLAFMHFIGGQQFEKIILLQILFLAAIPALIYGLASVMDSRPAGMIAALLMIFRERNSIALTNVIEVSHSKLILSDVPGLALILLFVFLLVRWLSQPHRENRLGIAAGASLGLVILIRSQAQLLIPVVLIGMVFVLRFQWRRILQSVLLFLIGLLAVAGPWVWRNYQVSGRLVVENTEHYIGFFASSYHTEEQSTRRLPGESTEDYYERMKQQVIDFVIQHPDEVAHFYASHFIHNEIHSIIYLPMSLRIYDVNSYVKEMGFWSTLQTDLRPGSVTLFFLSLGLIALGIGAAVNRIGILGLAPLLIHLAYSLTVVPVRLSGWRFILPVDWVTALYYAIGLAQVTAMALAILSTRYAGLGSQKRSGDREFESASLPVKDWGRTIPVLAAFLILGLSLPLSARYLPERYPEMSPQEIVRKYLPDGFRLVDGSEIGPENLLDFATSAGSVVTYGRALYPSFYEQGVYWGDDNPYNLDIRDYTRVQFHLVGQTRSGAFLPVSAPPDVFPHASDVVVIGCLTKSGNSTRALVVVVNQEIMLTASPWPGLTCEE